MLPLLTPRFFESSLSLLHSSLSLLHGSSINNLLHQSSSSQLQFSCHSCCSPARNEPSIMAEYDTVPQEADANQDALEDLESLESPSVRTLRKMHLINRPRSEAEKTLSVPARMRDRGLIKESFGDHIHLHLVMTAGMSAVLGLVHTIITT